VARPDPPASPPIVSHRAHQAAGGDSRDHTERHRPLRVRHPNDDPVDSPKPDSGETPPNRPEVPAFPSNANWPKPAPDGQPAPPDQPASSPTSSGAQAAPVR
jgi:hypothetical protein